MTDKILVVDDDINLLASMRRSLGRVFKITTASSAEEALEIAQRDGPFAVVLSDQRMPRVEGVAFLSEMAYRHPDTVRMMLTGNADQATAAKAVNEGKIFRFFSKPASIETVGEGLQAALKQHRLITAERELLEKTLAGSVKLLTDVLALLDAESVGRTRRMRDWGRQLAKRMGLANAWELDIAVMLHAIGEITAPPEVRAKVRAGQPLTPDEQDVMAEAPEVARNLIINIPRLKGVAEAVHMKSKRFDGGGFPPSPISGEAIPILGRVLRVLVDLDRQCGDGDLDAAPFDALQRDEGGYDPLVLAHARESLLGMLGTSDAMIGLVSSPVTLLRTGDRLAREIRDGEGRLILSAGFELTSPVIAKLHALKRLSRLPDTVPVYRAGVAVSRAS